MEPSGLRSSKFSLTGRGPGTPKIDWFHVPVISTQPWWSPPEPPIFFVVERPLASVAASSMFMIVTVLVKLTEKSPTMRLSQVTAYGTMRTRHGLPQPEVCPGTVNALAGLFSGVTVSTRVCVGGDANETPGARN